MSATHGHGVTRINAEAEFAWGAEATSSERPPLRVAVLIDGPHQPAWICKFLESIRDAEFSTLSAALLLAGPVPAVSSLSRSARILRNLSMRLDRRRYARLGDALQSRDVLPILGCPTVNLASVPGDGPVVLTPREEDGLRELSLDVIVCLTSARLRSGRAVARFGAWALTLGNGRDEHPGFSEFLAQEPTTCVEVIHLGDDGRALHSLTKSRGPTDTISLYRGRNRLYWRSVPLLLSALRRVHNEGSLPSPVTEALSGIRPAAGSGRILRSLAVAGARDLVHRMHDHLSREQWFIAYRFQDAPEPRSLDFSRFHRLVPPRDRIWADPFPVREGNRAWIFLEELVYSEGKGVIAVIEVDAAGHRSTPQRVIEEPYHLSYPCLFRWLGQWYMVPESSQGHRIQLYRCVRFPDRWEPATLLMNGVKAVDTTIFEHADRWWMLTSTASHAAMFDELSAFHAETPLGPWIPFRRNPVVIDIVGGRCAGLPFEHEGKLYRAVQDGSRRYGYGMELREIVRLTPDDLDERSVGAILPDWARGLVGTHTLNVSDGITVLDGVRYRWGRKPRRKPAPPPQV